MSRHLPPPPSGRRARRGDVGQATIDGDANRATTGRDSGQATVELALVLPVAVVVVLGLVQVGLAVRNELAVELAAREGARAASVSAAPGRAAATAARSAVDLPIDVRTVVTGSVVSVTVTFVDGTDVPIVGAVIGPTTHRATVSMALEPP